VLIALAAMTQSAVWPFHKWLTSSLNSPTPVSALMHAGLVNGGGFLLVRFAPLLLTQPMLLKAIFIAGLLTAVVGTFWKLLQTDIKRMLACSTMAQMGFMIAQCGMGLFAPAVSHLVWHGLFKAYLFLGTGSVIQEKRRKDPFGSITPVSFALACLLGTAGAFVFKKVTGIAINFNDTGSLMIGLAFMTTTQLACTLLERISIPRLLAAFTGSVAAGGLYGGSILLIEIILAPMNLWQPQPLDGIYAAGFAAIFLIWLAMNMNIAMRLQNSILWKRLYMVALNGSQPHQATITATRTAYQF
jgi:NAD(P)H-quinone oxidoreductase subunit 5